MLFKGNKVKIDRNPYRHLNLLHICNTVHINMLGQALQIILVYLSVNNERNRNIIIEKISIEENKKLPNNTGS